MSVTVSSAFQSRNFDFASHEIEAKAVRLAHIEQLKPVELAELYDGFVTSRCCQRNTKLECTPTFDWG